MINPGRSVAAIGGHLVLHFVPPRPLVGDGSSLAPAPTCSPLWSVLCIEAQQLEPVRIGGTASELYQTATKVLGPRVALGVSLPLEVLGLARCRDGTPPDALFVAEKPSTPFEVLVNRKNLSIYGKLGASRQSTATHSTFAKASSKISISPLSGVTVFAGHC